MKKLILMSLISMTIFFLISSASSLSTRNNNLSSSEKWSKIFGGNENERSYSIIQTNDNGYSIIGYTESYGNGQQDIWLLKIDEHGNHIWNKTYGGIKRERGYDIKQTRDNGFVIVGYTESFGKGLFDVWLLKTDENGNELWNMTYGGYDYDLGSTVILTDDNGYLITGATSSYGALNCNVWIIKTDQYGNMLWNKTYGGDICESSFSIVEADMGYIVVGYTESFGAGDYDGWVISIDDQGNQIWNKTFGGESTDLFRSIKKTKDNGFIIVGFTKSFGSGLDDIWIMKIDSNGTMQWNKTYGGPLSDKAYSICSTNDGYLITGYTTKYYKQSDIVLLKINESGRIIWQKYFGGNLKDYGQSVILSSDSGFAVAGWTETDINGNEDVYILKTDEFGNINKISSYFNTLLFRLFQRFPILGFLL